MNNDKSRQTEGSDMIGMIDLYQQREAIYPRSFKGFYRNLRLMGAGFLIALYFGMAWINLGGQQAILLDLPERKFHILGTTFWPQDFVLLAWLLIICAFGLFAITVFAGRVWCGYTCPQSVFTWIFIWIEKMTEGERNRRIKLDKQPMTPGKFWRKLCKHLLWLLVALATGLTFVGYFTPIRELLPEFLTLQAHPWALFWIGFFTLATYGNAGWLREQVCLLMCPYARFQSVMFDNDTLVIAYDQKRGEQRGSRKRNSDDYKAQGLGDCIDCNLCVQVCPTGIDIRDGLQAGCIGCAACVDVCDSIMGKMGYDKGLVSYTTDNQLTGNSKHWLRPRLIGYASALVVMTGLFLWTLGNRTMTEMEVLRDRNVLYRTSQTGMVENVYTLKIANKEPGQRQVTISVSGIPGLTLGGPATFTINGGEVTERIVKLLAPATQLNSANEEIIFTITSDNPNQAAITSRSRFMSPLQ